MTRSRARMLVAAAGALVLACCFAVVGEGKRLAAAPKCPVFPRSSHWNKPVDKLPLLGNSAAIVGGIGRDRGAHADFGSGLYEGAPIGIPFKVVSKKQRRVHVSFEYSDESDRGPYPIPAGVPVEGGRGSDGDRHVILIDKSRCRLYELYSAYPAAGGGWRAGSGAIWNLRSNKLRPRGWTSADAAGLPIFPGLARYDEVKAGKIDHALRITVPRTRAAYIYPARHKASSSNDPDLPAMGQRLRVKAGFDVSRFPRQARVVLRALKKYGGIVADNGSAWYITGAPSRGWDNDQLATLSRLRGSDWEAVDTSRLKRPR